MLTRAQKQEIIDGIKGDISKSKAIFLTNLVGISANSSVDVRKKVRDVGGKVLITRNSLFGKAAEGTFAEGLLKGLKGTNAVAFAFEDAATVAKVLNDAGKDLELVTLTGGYLGEQKLGAKEVKELANLPSRDQMLATVLATFMAPASAFVRVLHAIKEEKEKATA